MAPSGSDGRRGEDMRALGTLCSVMLCCLLLVSGLVALAAVVVYEDLNGTLPWPTRESAPPAAEPTAAADRMGALTAALLPTARIELGSRLAAKLAPFAAEAMGAAARGPLATHPVQGGDEFTFERNWAPFARGARYAFRASLAGATVARATASFVPDAPGGSAGLTVLMSEMTISYERGTFLAYNESDGAVEMGEQGALSFYEHGAEASLTLPLRANPDGTLAVGAPSCVLAAFRHGAPEPLAGWRTGDGLGGLDTAEFFAERWPVFVRAFAEHYVSRVAPSLCAALGASLPQAVSALLQEFSPPALPLPHAVMDARLSAPVRVAEGGALVLEMPGEARPVHAHADAVPFAPAEEAFAPVPAASLALAAAADAAGVPRPAGADAPLNASDVRVLLCEDAVASMVAAALVPDAEAGRIVAQHPSPRLTTTRLKRLSALGIPAVADDGATAMPDADGYGQRAPDGRADAAAYADAATLYPEFPVGLALTFTGQASARFDGAAGAVLAQLGAVVELQVADVRLPDGHCLPAARAAYWSLLGVGCALVLCTLLVTLCCAKACEPISAEEIEAVSPGKGRRPGARVGGAAAAAGARDAPAAEPTPTERVRAAKRRAAFVLVALGVALAGGAATALVTCVPRKGRAVFTVATMPAVVEVSAAPLVRDLTRLGADVRSVAVRLGAGGESGVSTSGGEGGGGNGTAARRRRLGGDGAAADATTAEFDALLGPSVERLAASVHAELSGWAAQGWEPPLTSFYPLFVGVRESAVTVADGVLAYTARAGVVDRLTLRATG